MDDKNNSVNLIDGLNAMPPKTKEPHSVPVLERWISLAETEMSSEQSGRLSWLVASIIVTAKLQQVIDATGEGRFLLKGGALLQHRLNVSSRATKDLDGIVRGDLEDFLVHLDENLSEPWGAIEFRRSEITAIEMPTKVIKPLRFEMYLRLRGRVWRKIIVEISPDEGNATSSCEEFPAPSLAGFGIPTPERLIGLSMSYQIAQKVHAASDPHDPPQFVNNRARDVVDLLLLKELAETTGSPSNTEIVSAIVDIFAARGREAEELGRPVRTWPSCINAHAHWGADYAAAAESVGVSVDLVDAVEQLNTWLDLLGSSGCDQGV